MRVNSLLGYLEPHCRLRLYIYAFDRALYPMCLKYNEVFEFATKEDILEFLINHKQSSDNVFDKAHANESHTIKHYPCLGLLKSLKLNHISADNASYFAAHELQELSLKTETINEILSVPELFIIDDYDIDKSFESKLFNKSKLFVIDDLANRHHKCHMLLDQTLDLPDDTYVPLCNEGCEFLIGSQYSLSAERFYPRFFNPQIKSVCTCYGHRHSYTNRAFLHHHKAFEDKGNCIYQDSVACPLPRVLISYGGADPVSACLKLTKTILEGKLYESYQFTMLAGATNKDFNQIESLVATTVPQSYKDNFVVLQHCKDVADLLFKHDIAMGAYGGMFRERIATGIPTISTVIADNQEGFDKLFEKLKLGYNLEFAKLSDISAVKQALLTTLERSEEYTKNSLRVYDGLGLKRISDAILKLMQQ